jgi:hypothetical protein
MLYRGPGFLADVRFGSSPPPPIFRQQIVSLSQSSCASPVEFTDGIGWERWERVGEEPIIRLGESLVLYNSFNAPLISKSVVREVVVGGT